jgi:hypothetical protein
LNLTNLHIRQCASLLRHGRPPAFRLFSTSSESMPLDTDFLIFTAPRRFLTRKFHFVPHGKGSNCRYSDLGKRLEGRGECTDGCLHCFHALVTFCNHSRTVGCRLNHEFIDRYL